jgi:hypothetical protein
MPEQRGSHSGTRDAQHDGHTDQPEVMLSNNAPYNPHPTHAPIFNILKKQYILK